jgi:hypothetical protein
VLRGGIRGRVVHARRRGLHCSVLPAGGVPDRDNAVQPSVEAPHDKFSIHRSERERLMARHRIWNFIKKVAGDIDDQVWRRSGPHGAAELSAALFHGSSPYVMYGQSDRHDQGRSDQEAKTEQTAESLHPEPDRERGGRRR